MGTIIKRNNLYSIVYDEPTEDGQRHQVMKSVRKLGGTGTSSKEAKNILAEIERKIRRGEYTNSGHTVESFLEEWLTYAETQVAATTYREYLNACRRHLIPKLGKVVLDQLSPVHVKNAYKKLQDSGLAPKTVKNIHNVLRGALEQAIRWRMLNTNPAALVDPPRCVRPDIQIAEGDQLRLILDRLRGREWYLPTLIALATGMRRGEVLALQWQDFNEEAKVLIVRRSLARVRDSEIILKETKSGRMRVVAIPEALVTELVAHREASAFTKPADWISCRKDGSHLAPGGLSLAFRRAANKLKISINFHSIRHTQATLLLSAGVSVKAVSERLGHSSTQITQDTYQHLLPHMQRQAADVVESKFFSTEEAEEKAEEK